MQPQNSNSKIKLTSKPVTNEIGLVSLSGTVYKFFRGVIGIDYTGKKYEIIIDDTKRSHNDATIEIGFLTKCHIKNISDPPFFHALEISEQGTIIIQLEGDAMLVYLPHRITLEQYTKLLVEITPRSNFKVSFTHDNNIYSGDDVNANALISFTQDLITISREIKR